MKFRNWIRKTPAGRLVWRLFIGFIGGGITVFGAVLLVAPGPGVLVLLAGLGILATEFAWAGRIMMHTKQMASKSCATHRYETLGQVLFDLRWSGVLNHRNSHLSLSLISR